MRFIGYLLAFLCVSSVYAGPHTIQKGETFADVAKLYNVPLDSIIKANPNTEAYAGLTIEVPLSTLVYDLGTANCSGVCVIAIRITLKRELTSIRVHMKSK